MSEVTGKLKDGLKIGNEVHKDFTLREVNFGDIIDGINDGERLMETPRGYVLVASNALTEAHVLRRQIERIGTYDGVVTFSMLRSLSQEDITILKDHADKLQAAISMAVSERGRGDPPSKGD